MHINIQIENNNISSVLTINAHAILEKYLSKRDRIVFCHRKNWWVENESYEYKYFYGVPEYRYTK